MGELHRKEGTRTCILTGRVLVGRSPACLLRFEDKRVSGEHARLVFRSGAWELRDLGSRNGTWVQGRRIAAGESVTLQQGDHVSFGQEGERWELVDASPPAAAARDAEDGTLVWARGGYLALPDDEHPRAFVYTTEDGGWLAEVGDDERAVRDQHVLEVDGRSWVLHLSESIQGTWEPRSSEPSLDDLTLRFEVSSDEEHVTLTLLQGGRSTPLPARAYDYLLLTLARARQKDLEDGAGAPGDRGWLHVDELCRQLQTDDNKLGVEVYRARRRLAELGVRGAAGLIERRRSTRQLRLGTERIELTTPSDD
ncbi:MAG: FHA domain-containing protein [Acidobacteriota bacterium]